MRGAHSTLFLIVLAALLAALVPATPPALAAENPAAAEPTEGTPLARDEPAEVPDHSDAPAEAPAASPWEHPLWHNATAMMRIYVCEYARRPPSWCGAPRELPANVALPESEGPPLMEEDARWLNFIENADPANLTEEEIIAVRRRALVRRDPQAMEILGYLYAAGQSVERDYKEAYRWYGMAFLAGETRVRPNMDIVWQQLQRHDLEGAQALTREFDALAAGEVPAGLPPPPDGPLPTSLPTAGPAPDAGSPDVGSVDAGASGTGTGGDSAAPIR
ncbi:MAG: hypothetical protein ACFB13_11125 [Kiloniellaceae bacterium]